MLDLLPDLEGHGSGQCPDDGSLVINVISFYDYLSQIPCINMPLVSLIILTSLHFLCNLQMGPIN